MRQASDYWGSDYLSGKAMLHAGLRELLPLLLGLVVGWWARGRRR